MPQEPTEPTDPKAGPPELPKYEVPKGISIEKELGVDPNATMRPEDLARHVTEARSEKTQKPTGSATKNEIAEQRAAVEAAYEAAGSLTTQMPEREVKQEVAPAVEEETVQTPQEAAPGQAREKAKSPEIERVEPREHLYDYSAEELKVAFKQSTELERALSEKVGKPPEDLDPRRQKAWQKRAEMEKLKRILEALDKFVVVFPQSLAREHRDAVVAKLGLQDVSPEFTASSYVGEDRDKITSLIAPRRARLLTMDHPFIELRYDKNIEAREDHPEDSLEITVKPLIPEVQKSILAGKANVDDFAESIARFKTAPREIQRRFKMAERARKLITEKEWDDLRSATKKFDDPQNERMDFARRFLFEDLPRFGSDMARLKTEGRGSRDPESFVRETHAMLKHWYDAIDTDEQREAAKKYADVAARMYSGTLSQKRA